MNYKYDNDTSLEEAFLNVQELTNTYAVKEEKFDKV